MKKRTAVALLAAMTVSAFSLPTASAMTDAEWADLVTKMNEEGVSISYVDDTDNTVINFEKDASKDNVTKIDMKSSTNTLRGITGIGTDATDDTAAASVAYVKQSVQGIATQEDVTNAVTQIENYVNQKAGDVINQANTYTNKKFDEASDHTNSVGAMSAAMASIPAPPTGGAGQSGWGVAVGTFHNKTAVAAGLHYDISDNVRLHAKAAMEGRESMLGVGLGGTFGTAKRQTAPKHDDAQLRELMRRLEALEKMKAAGTLTATTENYTNIYGHSFYLKPTGSGVEMYNLDGTKMTDAQLRKFAEDFAYNNEGREFDITNFKKNNNGNWQYQDPEVGWLPGSEQAAVGTEKIEMTTGHRHETAPTSAAEEAAGKSPRKESSSLLDKILDE